MFPVRPPRLRCAKATATADAARIASWATMLLATGTILGCLIMAPIANRLGRRGALAFFFTIMAFAIPMAFGYTFYPGHGGLRAFLLCLFAVGIGGASFAVQLLWLPEQYRRASAGAAPWPSPPVSADL